MTATITAKVCTACNVHQPLDNFHNNRRNADGHAYTCKTCVRHRKEANKDKIATYRRAHYRKKRNELNARSRADRRRLQELTRANSHAISEPWTDDDDDFLMADDGLSVTNKALKLGRTYAACISRRTRLRKTTHRS